MSADFQINDRSIGVGTSPFLIAEMSANHNGSIEAAYKIIDAAAESGADAVKMQTYRPDTITIDSDLPDFQISDGLWGGRTLYDLYEEAHTPWDWHKPLFEYARQRGITIFSSPFDATAIDLLEELNTPAYKIASFEAVDHELIRYAASTGKPLIISTGLADLEEIGEAVQAAREAGCQQLALLHCVSGYPAPPSDYNLRVIPDMAKRFGCVVGLSDHTLDHTTAIAAVAMGASIIEKHFTLNREGGGPDDSFSMEPAHLRALCGRARTAWDAMGSVDYGHKSSECGNVKFRRSLYCVKEIRAGERLTHEHVRSIRPGYGLPPKYLETLVGMRVTQDLPTGKPMSWDLIE